MSSLMANPASLDRSRADAGLVAQIVQLALADLASGRLVPGQRLPSIRACARQLAVSLYTVTQAYETLVSRGVVHARHGAGYFVGAATALTSEGAGAGARVAGLDLGLGADTLSPALAPLTGHTLLDDPAEPVTFAVSLLADDARTPNSDGADAATVPKGWCKPGSGFLPASWLQDLITPAMLNQAWRALGTLTSPAPTQGTQVLREALAQRLRRRGLSVHRDQIVTSFGASHALVMATRSACRAGDAVVLEDPCYMVLAPMLRALGLKVCSVPRCGDQLDWDALETVVREQQPKLMFVQTLLHNPTGSSLAPAAIHRLLMLAERHDFYVVEDDALGDLAPDHATRLAQLDQFRRVYYVGSFSKLLSPALRVGYLVPPKAKLAEVLAHKALGVLSSASLNEALVTTVLMQGRYDQHLQSLAERLRRARQHVQATMATAGWQFEPHAAGFFVWAELPSMLDHPGSASAEVAGMSAQELAKHAAQQQLILAAGGLFSDNARYARYLRINLAQSLEPSAQQWLANPGLVSGALAGSNFRESRP